MIRLSFIYLQDFIRNVLLTKATLMLTFSMCEIETPHALDQAYSLLLSPAPANPSAPILPPHTYMPHQGARIWEYTAPPIT